MPKLSHEALVHLVRAAPEVIVGLLQRELGLELPAMAHPRITAAELVDLNLAEYRADAVITLGPDDAPTEAFVLEAQNDVDLRKRPRTGRRAHRPRRPRRRARPRQGQRAVLP